MGRQKQREGRFVPEQGSRIRGEQTDLIMGFVLSHKLLDVKTTTGQNVFRNNFKCIPADKCATDLFTRS